MPCDSGNDHETTSVERPRFSLIRRRGTTTRAPIQDGTQTMRPGPKGRPLIRSIQGPEGPCSLRPGCLRPECSCSLRSGHLRPDGPCSLRPVRLRPEGPCSLRPVRPRPEGPCSLRPVRLRPEGPCSVRPGCLRPEGSCSLRSERLVTACRGAGATSSGRPTAGGYSSSSSTGRLALARILSATSCGTKS